MGHLRCSVPLPSPSSLSATCHRIETGASSRLLLSVFCLSSVSAPGHVANAEGESHRIVMHDTCRPCDENCLRIRTGAQPNGWSTEGCLLGTAVAHRQNLRPAEQTWLRKSTEPLTLPPG